MTKSNPGWRPKHVFVTTHLDLARAYAYMYARSAHADGTDEGSGGAVYEVQVPNAVRIDSDFHGLASTMGGPFSFYVKKRLRVTKVVDTVTSNPALEYRLFAPYQTWASTSESPGIHPLWTDEGYVRPSPSNAQRGITSEALEKQFGFGPYPGQEALIKSGIYSL